jgi:FlaA1/EpsC-like NDP-sugar epimerase
VVWSLGGLLAIFFRYDNTFPSNSFKKIGLAALILTPLYFFISYIDARILGAQKSGTFEYYFSIIRKFFLSGIVFFIFLSLYPDFILPKSYPLLTSILAVSLFFIFLQLYRFITLKYIYYYNDIPIAIYGAGYQGQVLLEKISKDFSLNWKPILILDDDSNINVSRINGVRVITNFNFYEIFKKYNIKILIISFQQISSAKLQEIQKICEKFEIELRIISPMAALLGKDFKEEDVRAPTTEELLGKTSIKINYEIAKKFIENKKVLITGAGGSIGSELSKQINFFKPKL